MALILCAGCPPPDPNLDAGQSADAGELSDAGVIEEDGFYALLDDVRDFDDLVGASGTVKYLLPVDGAAPRAPLFDTCAFQDTAEFAFHVIFLNSLPGGEDIDFQTYIDLVIRRANRAWWGGDVLFQPQLAHPITGGQGQLQYTIYTEDSPGNRLVIDDVRAVDARMKECAPAFASMLVFVASSNEQRQTAQLVQGELADEGIAVLVQP